MATNFRDLLSRPVESAEKPQPLPVGHYLGIIKGNPVYEESKNKKTPYARLTVQLHSAEDDVDQDQLLASLKGDMGSLSKKSFRKDYYLTDDAIWRLRAFIESCGITFGGGRTFEAAIAELTNKTVRVDLGVRPDENGVPMFNDIGEMIGAE